MDYLSPIMKHSYILLNFLNSGLLTHMEHMRMDPKHQFAAQYMLSRAAAERRERDTILAAVAGNSSLLSIGQNSRGASPSAHSEDSCNGRLSSPPPNDNNNNGSSGMNENTSDNNNNTSGTTNNLSSSGIGSFNGKLTVNDMLRSQTSGHLHQQYQIVAAAAQSIVAQNQNSCNGLGSPGNPATSAAQSVANLAAVVNHMRQNQPMSNGNQQLSPHGYHQNNQSMTSSHLHHHHHHQQSSQQHHQQEPNDATLRIHQAEVLLRSQAEAALRLAVSQAAAVVASNGNGNDTASNNQFRHHHNSAAYNNHHQQSQFTPDLSEALRLQEQRLEQALRLGSELHQQHNNMP